MDSYGFGAAIVTFSVFATLAGIAAVEVYCEVARVPSLALRIEHWSDKNNVLEVALLLVWATLLAHFVLNKLNP